jgi:hypothetical protein
MEEKTVKAQKKALIEKLSPLQAQYFEALDWYMNGAIGAGRTHLMCTVVLMSLLNGREPAILIDHSPMHEGNRNYTLAILYQLANEIGLKIKVDKRDTRGIIYVTRDKSELMYEWIRE